jgi:hypothetical protein
MTGTLRKDLSTFFTISPLILLRKRNVSDKVCRENQNTFHNQHIFFLENCTIYETMSKNMVEPEEPQMTSQYGTYALRTRLARLHELIRMQTPTRPGTHARTHACTHRQTRNTFFFYSNNDSRKLLNVTLYVHCLSCSTYWRYSLFCHWVSVYQESPIFV